MKQTGQFLVFFILTITLGGCSNSSGKSKDTTAPVISLTGDNPQVIEAGTVYVELGATAFDNRDGDLSAAISIDAGTVDTQAPGSYSVTYAVTDAAGNSGNTTRTVIVEDTTPPVITLLGADPQIIVAGNSYLELGVSASDTLDGDLSAQIVVDATAVDTMVAGDYTVTYDVTDAAGNAAVTVTRTVRVELPPPPAAPQVTVEGDIKQLIFSWQDVADADYFRLLENPDGHSGYTPVGGDIPSGKVTTTRDIAVHFQDWANALYIVEACNLGGCSDSESISAVDVMLDTIGYFKASNPGEGDGYGHVALSQDGKTLAVGVPGEDSIATGVNGDQTDDSASGAGAVYVFHLDGSGWAQQAYIKASNTDAEDEFGAAVALSGDGNTLAVGARREDSGATGINGVEADNSKEDSGAVYVFHFDGSRWTQQAYVKASNTDNNDWFGVSVALSADGHTLASGALNEDSGATGINGDQSNSGYRAGAVYVFQFDGTEWSQHSYIKASNTGRQDYFGHPLALSADGATLAVGAQGEDSAATGINGDEFDDSAVTAGAAYLFRFDGDNWSQQAYVKASNTEPMDRFSLAVSLSGDGNILAVGAPHEDSLATGINGDQYDDQEIESCGAVYVFRYDGAEWSQQAYVKASNTGSGNMETCDPRHPDLCSWAGDHFGGAVALNAEGNILAVGATGEDSSATGIGGDQADDSTINAGAVYVFRFNGTDWYQDSYVKASNTETDINLPLGWGDNFGSTVALSSSGRSLVVAAAGEDSESSGVDGDQADNSATESGAVYIY